jgi:putative ABC transport system permease protein
VQGIYYDYASDLGYIVIARSVYRELFADHTISNCAIYLKSGTNAEDVKKQIESKIHTMLLSIRTTGQLRSEAIKIFDRTFSITYALHTIAIVISMLAITNSLYALTMESRREFGVLRYMGANAGQIRKIVLAEAGILGVGGNIGGVALGFVLSLLLIFVINRQSFGWTIQFSIPYDFIFQSSTMVLIASLIAGVLPARLAARTLSPSVVRDE